MAVHEGYDYSSIFGFVMEDGASLQEICDFIASKEVDRDVAFQLASRFVLDMMKSGFLKIDCNSDPRDERDKIFMPTNRGEEAYLHGEIK